MILKKLAAFLMILVMLCGLLPSAMADDAGVLSENELSAWLDQLLLSTRDLAPLNAPVGEESLTEDGYAFLYEFATLYYDKPVLDASSVLQAVSITSESCAAPRSLTIGQDEMALLDTFGWQNPYLMGDGSFAAFYRMEELPRAAYWSWAQHDDEWKLTSVQCAIHVKAGENAYTDAGVRFLLEDGLITDIRIYGLSRFITGEDVQANLAAVQHVESAALGEHWTLTEHAEGYFVAHDAAAFGQEDLAFSGMDYRTLTITSAEALLGQPSATETADGRIRAEWTGAYLTGTDDGMDMLSVMDAGFAGPRGVRVGQTLEEVIRLFGSDGEGRTLDGMYDILYGDGVSAPYALMESGEGMTALSYVTQLNENHVTLYLTFEDAALQEWMLYSW